MAEVGNGAGHAAAAVRDGGVVQKPILVTGAGGGVGSIGHKVVGMLTARGLPVRAQVRRLDERSEALSKLGADLVVADFTSLGDTHRAVQGCGRIFFCVSVSGEYLECALNMAAVARYYGVEVFVNTSQMSVSAMSITQSSTSRQQRYHWLVEQALGWSGLPVVELRATIFLEHPFYNGMAAKTISKSGEIRLPFKRGRTSPIATIDVARVAFEVLVNPEKHVGKVYNLCGPVQQDMDAVAVEYSKALGRQVKYVDVPFEEWEQTDLKEQKFPDHINNHFKTLAWQHFNDKMSRRSDDVELVTGVKATTIEAWVRQNSKFFLGESISTPVPRSFIAAT